MSVQDWLRGHAGRIFLGGAAAAVLLLGWGFVAPRVALAGWLTGLLFWLGLALGGYALLAVHALTGGKWLAPLFPVLAPAVATLPVFAILALPLLLDAGAVWPWVADPGSVPPDVARLWLNLPGLVLRSALALLGWSVFGLLLVGIGARRPGIGAPALILHAVALTIIGLDWILALEPPFRSTAFAMWLGVTQLLAALAWCALLEPEPGGKRAADLAGLLLACLLGAAYLGFAQYLVAWYGDLKPRVDWYLPRQEMPWLLVECASIAASAVLPVVAMLPGVLRRSPRALAWIGGGVLAGVLLHIAWLVGPGFGPWMLPAALLGTFAIGGLWLGLAGGPFAARLRKEVPHGA